MNRSRKARRARLLAGALVAGALLVATTGAVSAADPEGRAASAAGLTEAFAKITFTDLIVSARPLEEVSFNFERALDPEQPGADPGDGGGDTN